MNLNSESVSSEEKLLICRRYFIIGCFGLPFVWLVNGLWFIREGFFVKSEVTTRIRRYVLFSWLGALIWIAAFILWTSVYQTQRQNWGKSGIYLSFVLPGGVA
ncbi:PREDICTED: gamma-secretase subunit PEN-2-like [Amphimedon queenslandica]|uniref:Gamma-secretase subunit PEN-2 n=1 Tax=Amphimedon queenslandica TaxID=400682 RepID=A0A1X7VP29_AMPQE|nr:PREDICTED: gamma-secretase subunit PEN-2-like [Amphimedon queenslandica]|eukprot:XP_011407614.1 PREDICTED: gamma-secretase subunit PEN-2-like [Amphimedon queenslandica]